MTNELDVTDRVDAHHARKAGVFLITPEHDASGDLISKLVQSHIRIVSAIIGYDAAISLGGGDDPTDYFALIITTGPNGAHATLLQEPRFFVQELI